MPGIANKIVTINLADRSIPIAGPNSLYNDSMWNGSSARPLPQLWDDHAVNIGFLGAAPSGTTSLDITEDGQSDCLTPVLRIVEVH